MIFHLSNKFHMLFRATIQFAIMISCWLEQTGVELVVRRLLEMEQDQRLIFMKQTYP